jgi:hypothetical protein
MPRMTKITPKRVITPAYKGGSIPSQEPKPCTPLPGRNRGVGCTIRWRIEGEYYAAVSAGSGMPYKGLWIHLDFQHE